MVRGPIVLVAVVAVVLGTVGFVAAKPRLFSAVLPPEVIQSLEVMTGSQPVVSAASVVGKTPSDFLVDSSDGLQAQGPIAAALGNRPVFIDAVVLGYTTQVSEDIPAEITKIRPILGCQLTSPMAGSVVGHVTAGVSGVPLAMRTYNDTHLAAEVQRVVDMYRDMGGEAAFVSQAPAYESYDVVVTETRAPVYLVLEDHGASRIWNIHPAPGVRIERVVLLGGGQAGVANLDPVVPVEALLDDGLAACGIAPAYPLNDGHLTFQMMDRGEMPRTEAEQKLAELRAAIDIYDTWFRDSFGVGAVESRIGFDAGTISVIGPVPGDTDPKANFQPITGAKIRTTQDQFFEIAGQVSPGTDFASRVMAIATTFAFGDLQTLEQGVRF